MFTSPSADNDRPGLDMEERLAWYTLELRSSTGDAMLWSSGVLRRHTHGAMKICSGFFAFLEEVLHSLLGSFDETIALQYGLVATWMKP